VGSSTRPPPAGPCTPRPSSSSCARSTRTSGSTSTACAARRPPAPSARSSGRTRTARSRRCPPSTSAKRCGWPWGAGEGPGAARPASPHAPPAPSQSELSDGIAMLVAGNDRIQAIITQMEEICHTIEVGTRRGVPRVRPWAVPTVGTRRGVPRCSP